MMVGIQTVYKQRKCTRFFFVISKDDRMEELQRIKKEPQINYLWKIKRMLFISTSVV